MSISISINTAYGMWAAWKLGRPLMINGREVFVPDAIGRGLFPAAPGADERPPTRDYSDPQNQRHLARKCAFMMHLAECELAAFGVDLATLATSNSANGAGVGTGGGPFEPATHTFPPTRVI